MSAVHRALIIWLFLLAFAIVINVRVSDQNSEWNWFLVLIPVWLLDLVLLVYNGTKLVCYYRDPAAYQTTIVPLPKLIGVFVAGVLLKIVFQVLLCQRLQSADDEMKMSYVMIPLWLLLIGMVVVLFKNVFVLDMNALRCRSTSVRARSDITGRY